MSLYTKRFSAVFLSFFIFSLIGLAATADDAEARSRSGGRSFSGSRSYRPPAQSPQPSRYTAPPQNPTGGGGFMRGLGGGLLGGAIGGLLFGSLAHGGMGGGLGGSGLGLLPILLFAGAGYFIYSRFFKKRPASSQAHYYQGGAGAAGFPSGSQAGGAGYEPLSSSSMGAGTFAQGLAAIRRTDPDFDPEHFKDVAQDVFFQVQAGWMRRDLQAYRHLLGERLAQEYEGHFAELRQKGQINKLESIAIRKVELVDAGTEANEDFVTLLFTANLLDYTIDERSNAVVSGSMTEPVKFAEEWTWARPAGTLNWKLEGIEVVRG
ncbi:MAG: Tim44 domain-containing protein [Pseudomonadota bacterium]